MVLPNSLSSYYEKFLATEEVKCIDEEIPFEIPQGWEWTRLGELVTYQNGYSYTSAELNKENKGLPVIKSGNLMTYEVELKPNNDYVEFPTDKMLASLIRKGDMLMCLSSQSDNPEPLGKTAIYKNDNYALLNQRVLKMRPYLDDILAYLYYVINSEYFHYTVSHQGGGSAQANLKLGHVLSMLVPIAPFKEELRIVDKISKLNPLIAHYDLIQQKECDLNNEINDKLKKSILQEAIQGRLVPQIPEEGTAQELLEQIQQEKSQLIKECKLKKSALTDSIIFKGDDNKYYEQVGKKCEDITDLIPFELPSSWIWVRGKSVFMPMESTKPTSDFVYIDVDAVNNKINIIDNPKFLKQKSAPSRATRKLHKNDLLFSMVRPYLKNIALVSEKYKNAIASTGFYVITPSIGYKPMFLFYLMLSNYVIDGLNSFMKGDNSPSINNCHIENYLYPLPPLQEQQRIVVQIERLFEQLK
ncbi:restriction endonuclease subunit S [Bacteroides uniformis]|jgi:type I restriction enzyme S subunit|uniref:restriction endonuclease subunit S n=1 Tax=Bacteroides uniformis TaxID=820 RepID=UPI000E596A20|nr:restriction endonuclease subunit S [Bacteroides uniformis]RHD59499.1 restriction endonuclease subunit S [Bacteroides uniformis]